MSPQYVPWVSKFVTKTVGTNYKYTNIHNLYYKQFRNNIVDYLRRDQLHLEDQGTG